MKTLSGLVLYFLLSEGFLVFAARDKSNIPNERYNADEETTPLDLEPPEEQFESDTIGDRASEWASSLVHPYAGGSFSLGDDMVGVYWDFNRLFNDQNGWWNGPHVCTSRTVINITDVSEESGGNILMTHHTFRSVTCDQTNTAFRCITQIGSSGHEQKITEIHECCHGYRRVEGQSGCPEALHLVDMKTTLEELGASQFVKALESLNLVDVLTQDNFTIFAPDDEAFEVYFPIKPSDMDVVVVSPNMIHLASDIEETLLTHMARGVHSSGRLEDEGLIETVEADIHIRTNMFDINGQLLTANCVPIISPDNLSSNGVVHIINKVLSPVVDTIAHIINKKPQLTLFTALVEQHGMLQTLREAGQYTLFAPTNDAFVSIPPALRIRILNGDGCVSNLVSHHILGHTVCSSIINGRIQTKNILRETVQFRKDDKTGNLYINDIPIETTDIMATNGVIHLITKIIIPDAAVGVSEIAARAGATDWIKFVNDSNMKTQVDSLNNFTMFVPVNQALLSLTETERDNHAANIIDYHLVTKDVSGAQLHPSQSLPTLHDNNVIRVHRYHSTPFGLTESRTAQCATILKTDIKSCGGTIHLIDKVLKPPSGDLFTTLTNDGRFHTFLRLIRQANLENLLRGTQLITIIAPTDTAFERLTENQMHMLTEESDYKLGNFLKHHILYGDLCCAGIFEGPFFWKQKERAMDGTYVKVGRQGSRIHVDHNTAISQCDNTATNGVVHVIDEVMPSATHRYFRHRWSGNLHRRGRIPQAVDTMMNGINGVIQHPRVRGGIRRAQDTWTNGVHRARNVIDNGVNEAKESFNSGVENAQESLHSGMSHARDTWDDVNDHLNSHLSNLFGNKHENNSN